MTSAEGDGPADQLSDFADDVSTLRAKVPEAIDKGVEDTAKELKEIITSKLEERGTAKGGTFDSRTSPYSPGGENDSSTDSLHITDVEAWNHGKRKLGEYHVYPNHQVSDRAEYIEYGTTDHGPDGEVPMYFKVGNKMVVMSTAGPDAELSARFQATPTPVEGVEGQHYFEHAIYELKSRNALEENIRDRLEEAARESMGT